MDYWMSLKVGDKFKMKYSSKTYTLFAISHTGRSYYTNKEKTEWFDIKTIGKNFKKIIKENNNE